MILARWGETRIKLWRDLEEDSHVKRDLIGTVGFYRIE
jgi:hypothetical protein